MGWFRLRWAHGSGCLERGVVPPAVPVVPRPVVVWEVVVNTDCEMWSHRDGFPGVGWSGLVSGGVWVGVHTARAIIDCH